MSPAKWSVVLLSCLLLGADQRPAPAVLPVEIRGQLVKLDRHERASAAVGVIIRVRGLGNPVRTDSGGNFYLTLPGRLYRVGQRVDLEVELQGWQIWEPVGGHALIPAESLQQLVTVKLLEVGSRKLLSDAAIEDLIRRAVLKERVSIRGKESPPKPLDLGVMIREWAVQYGFSAEEVRAQVDKWVAEVKVNRATNWEKRCLAMYAEQRFQEAAQCFDEGAEAQVSELERHRQATLELEEQVVRGFIQAGSSHKDYDNFEAAMAEFQKARKRVSRELSPELWAKTLVWLGISHESLGIRVKGSEAQNHLSLAVAAYKEALQVYTKAQFPEDWAKTQNNLGIALKHQGIQTGGEEGKRLIAQSVATHREALQVGTREDYPQLWFQIQNNLANTLKDQAIRSSEAEAPGLLSQSATVYDELLQVYTQAKFPKDWSAVQNNLGIVLYEQGIRTGGEDGTGLLAQAAAAYKQALVVRTRAQLPQLWAQTQNNLANALQEQGTRTEGKKGADLLAEAVAAYDEAFQVRTRAQLPQQWAQTQNNLGLTLQEQGIRADGEERARLLARAMAAYRSALEIRTFETLPGLWRETQGNLCHLYSEGMFEFEKAFDLYREMSRRFPDDLSVEVDFAEAYVTTGRFAEALPRIANLITHPKLGPSTRTVVRALELVALAALGHSRDVPAKLQALRGALAAQPGRFFLGRKFTGTKHMVVTSARLSAARAWLLPLMDALSAKDRGAILTALDAIRGLPR